MSLVGSLKIMSYEIDYRQKAYFLNEDKSALSEKDYLVLHEVGSNNCYEANSRKRSRDWDIMGFGWAYSIWHKIAEWVGITAGHCLEIKGLKHDYSKETDIDKYMDITEKGLKKYYNLIKKAKPIEKIFDDFRQISIYIRLGGESKKKLMQLDDIKEPYYKDQLKKYLTNYKLKLEENKDWYGYKQSTVRMEIKTVKDLTEAIKMKRYDDGVQFSVIFHDKMKLSID